MIEVHPEPERALSDGEQSLSIPEFQRLMEEIAPVAELAGKLLARLG